MGFNIGGILKGIVPFIASALPGPLGGIAKGVLNGVFGLDEDSDEEKIAAAVANATPDQIIALKKAEQDFQVRMAEMGFASVAALEKLAREDVANARQREIEMARTGKRDFTPMILAFAAIAGFISVLVFLLTADLDKWGQTKVGLVTGILGTLTTIVVMIFAYYFGSSSGSAAKNAHIQKLTTGNGK